MKETPFQPSRPNSGIVTDSIKLKRAKTTTYRYISNHQNDYQTCNCYSLRINTHLTRMNQKMYRRSDTIIKRLRILIFWGQSVTVNTGQICAVIVTTKYLKQTLNKLKRSA